MGFGRGTHNSRLHGLIPIGVISLRIHKDRWDNDVSEIMLADGSKFNMVHHTPKSKWWRTHSTIYGGRGKFIKVRTSSSEDECAATVIEVGGYKVAWGDGEVISVENNPRGPDLKLMLEQISDNDFDTVIVNVLSAIQYVDAAWTYKEIEPGPTRK